MTKHSHGFSVSGDVKPAADFIFHLIQQKQVENTTLTRHQLLGSYDEEKCSFLCLAVLFLCLQILVHGEQNEMARLKAALIREYEDNDEVDIEVHNPRNTEAVTLNFRGEKLAKVCLKLCGISL